MSNSRKDGRRRGGHRRMWPDVWSGRYHKVNFWIRHGKDHKVITVRWERRTERQRLLGMMTAARDDDDALVAKWTRHRPSKPGIAGSNPAWGD